MKTAVKSKGEKPKVAKEAAQSTILHAQEIEEAIRSKFRKIEGTISIRHLWEFCDVHRFRVNWWISSKITTSKFLMTFQEDDGNLVIKEIK